MEMISSGDFTQCKANLGQGQEGMGFLQLGGSVHTATPLPQWNLSFLLHRNSPSTAETKQVQLPAPGRQCKQRGWGEDGTNDGKLQLEVCLSWQWKGSSQVHVR